MASSIGIWILVMTCIEHFSRSILLMKLIDGVLPILAKSVGRVNRSDGAPAAQQARTMRTSFKRRNRFNSDGCPSAMFGLAATHRVSEWECKRAGGTTRRRMKDHLIAASSILSWILMMKRIRTIRGVAHGQPPCETSAVSTRGALPMRTTRLCKANSSRLASRRLVGQRASPATWRPYPP